MHWHKWEVVANCVETFKHGTETEVLYRCSCGRVKVENLLGGWTLEQLRGKNN